ncbi:SWIM zinc finger family protein [Saccharothrix sp. Mg75]|uniref:SWIM zinc finger family protein n=1 Tax=Saccharothrix sp. Mg75 TaxID=3445357 RepID=UPI003EEECD48
MGDRTDRDDWADRDDWHGERPGARRAVRVEGGLTLRSRRGDVARTWWSRRFVEVLESFGMGGRLARGRGYARTGQVMSLSLSTSLVVALVTGTRREPYRARVGVRKFSDEEWSRIEHALADRAIFAAKLLAGEMPPEIEEVFADLGLTLFPGTLREMSMDCTCPDWEVPCKHLAATCYLLAESFDTDPFEILAWRGRSREDLLDRLRELRAPLPHEEPPPPAAPAPEVEVEPEADAFAGFWVRRKAAEAVPEAAEPGTARPDALLDQLDPLVVDGRSLTDDLRPLYRRIARSPRRAEP